VTHFVKIFSKWQNFLRSPLSKAGQTIPSHEEIAAPVMQVGNTTVTQLRNSPRKCGIELGLHIRCLGLTLVIYPKTIFHHKKTQATEV